MSYQVLSYYRTCHRSCLSCHMSCVSCHMTCHVICIMYVYIIVSWLIVSNRDFTISMSCHVCHVTCHVMLHFMTCYMTYLVCMYMIYMTRTHVWKRKLYKRICCYFIDMLCLSCHMSCIYVTWHVSMLHIICHVISHAMSCHDNHSHNLPNYSST